MKKLKVGLCCVLVLCTILCTSSVAAPLRQTRAAAAGTNGVVVVSSSHYRSEYGNELHVVGEVRNDTAGNVSSVRITAVFYNASDSVVGTADSAALLDILMPGQVSPFSIWKWQPPAFSRYALIVAFSQTSQAPVPQLLATSTNQYVRYDYLHIVGQVTNLDTSNLAVVQVFCTLYDNSGTVINVGSTFASISLLAPGQVSPFKLGMSGPTTAARVALGTDGYSTREVPPNLRSVNTTFTRRSAWGDDSLILAGEVENLGPTQAEYVSVVGSLYDGDGRLVDCAEAVASPSSVLPGQRSAFEITFRDQIPLRPTYALYPPEAHLPTPTPTTIPPTATPIRSPTPCSDAYEPDNRPEDAKTITVNEPPQLHNFATPGDRDYVKFAAKRGWRYTIRTLELSGSGNDTKLSLLTPNGAAVIVSNDDDPAAPPASRIDWTCSDAGNYIVLVEQYDPAIAGCDKTYRLQVVGVLYEATPTATGLPPMTPTKTRVPSAWLYLPLIVR